MSKVYGPTQGCVKCNKIFIFVLIIFAYSESKLTCHFVVVLVLLLGGKRSKKVGKRSKKVTSS